MAEEGETPWDAKVEGSLQDLLKQLVEKKAVKVASDDKAKNILKAHAKDTVKSLNNLEKSREDWKKKNEETLDRLVEANKKVEQFEKGQTDVLKRQRDEHQAQLTEMEEKVLEKEQEWEEKLNALENEKKALEDEAKSLEEHVKRAEDGYTQKEQELTDAQQKIEKLKADLDDEKKTTMQNDEDIKAILAREEAAQKKAQDLEKELQTQRANSEAAGGEIAGNADLEEKVSEQTRIIEELRASLEKAQHDLHSMPPQDTAAAAGGGRSLLDELGDADSQDGLGDADSRNKLETDLEAARRDAEDARNHTTQLEEQVHKALDELESEKAKASEAKSDSEAKIAQLEQQLADAEAKATAVQSEASEASDNDAAVQLEPVRQLDNAPDDNEALPDNREQFLTDVLVRLSELSQEVQARNLVELNNQIQIHQAEYEKHQGRVGGLEGQIKRDPANEERSRRQIDLLRKEVNRLKGLLEALRIERQWLQDLVEFSESTRRAAEEQLFAQREAQANHEANGPAGGGAAGGGPVAAGNRNNQGARRGNGNRGGRQGIEFGMGGDNWRVRHAFNLDCEQCGGGHLLGNAINGVVFVFMFITIIAESRQYTIWKNANAVTRGLLMAAEPSSMCIRQPNFQAFWEFIALLLAGHFTW